MVSHPGGGLGIGIAAQVQSFFERRRARRELREIGELEGEEAELIDRYHAERAASRSHGVATLSISLFLSVIYSITGGGFPWFLIPSGGLALSYVIRLASRGPRITATKREITGWRGAEVRSVNRLANASGSGPGVAPIVLEAETMKAAVSEQLAIAREEGIDLGSDFEELLRIYVEQVRRLSARQEELSSITRGLDEVKLGDRRRQLVERRGRATLKQVRDEYDRSIADVDRQLTSFQDLQSRREIIDLRIHSAVNFIRQIQLDLARAKGAVTTNETSFEPLRDRFAELYKYLEDLESGWEELE